MTSRKVPPPARVRYIHEPTPHIPSGTHAPHVVGAGLAQVGGPLGGGLLSPIAGRVVQAQHGKNKKKVGPLKCGQLARGRNSGERMSGRERTGADFYPPPGGFRSPFRSPGRPGGAPRAQNPGRQRGKKNDPFLTLF